METDSVKMDIIQGRTYPTHEHSLLNVFAGRWRTEGKALESPFGPSFTIKGEDTYEWLHGNFFLVHKVNVFMGEDRLEGIEIIGYDKNSRTYPMYSFDNSGNSTKYEASNKDGIWTFTGKSERALVTIGDGIINAHWEQLHKGTNWLPWLEVTLKKLQ